MSILDKFIKSEYEDGYLHYIYSKKYNLISFDFIIVESTDYWTLMYCIYPTDGFLSVKNLESKKDVLKTDDINLADIIKRMFNEVNNGLGLILSEQNKIKDSLLRMKEDLCQMN